MGTAVDGPDAAVAWRGGDGATTVDPSSPDKSGWSAAEDEEGNEYYYNGISGETVLQRHIS